jgi:hypothetical protein
MVLAEKLKFLGVLNDPKHNIFIAKGFVLSDVSTNEFVTLHGRARVTSLWSTYFHVTARNIGAIIINIRGVFLIGVFCVVAVKGVDLRAA